ncbi:MAG: hypothetical protein JNJ46_30820 [Myxococcales bacterium]|nr:hypothetical protein [Myxococcales bacterium]
MSRAPLRIVGLLFALLGMAASCATPGQESLEDLTKKDTPCSCTVGARRCRGGQIQVCEQQSATCAEWGPIVGCPGAVMCRDSESCDVDCNGKDQCAAGISRCADDSTAEICRIGQSGCLEWSRQSCQNKNFCDPRGGQCVPAVPCDGECPKGFGCQNSGICSGGRPDDMVVNVKTVQVSGKVTLNGKDPEATADCSETRNPYERKAQVQFVEINKGYTFTFGTRCQEAGYDVGGTLYPGTYRVSVSRGSSYQTSNLPSTGFVANAMLTVAADLTGQVFDVKTVQLGGKVTLNGKDPEVTSDCSGTRNPYERKAQVQFVETSKGYTFTYGPRCLDTGFEFSGMIFPGTYRVSVSRGSSYQTSNLPSTGFVATGALTVAADLSGQVFDVRTIQVLGKVTLNGKDPEVTTECSATRNPYERKVQVQFVETSKGYTFTYGSRCVDSGFEFSGALYPGTYQVLVNRGSSYQTSNLPSAGYIATSGLAISADLMGQVFDVKTLRVAGRVTLNGKDPEVTTDCSDTRNPYERKAQVRLNDAVRGYTFTFGSLCLDSDWAFEGQIYPGTYQITASRGSSYQTSNLPSTGYVMIERVQLP